MTQLVPERPQIRQHLFAGTIKQDEVFVLAEDRVILWKSRGFGLLIPELDGTKTHADLFERLGTQMSPPEIMFLLRRLGDFGLLAEGHASEAGAYLGAMDLPFLHAFGVSRGHASRTSSQAEIRLNVIDYNERADLLQKALKTAGVTVAEGADRAFDVVLADNYFRPELSAINRRHLARQSPWMACKLVGRTLWVGPIFRPGSTGCLACLQNRLRLNRQVEDYVVRKTGDRGHYSNSVGSLRPLTQLGATWAANEIALWLMGREDRLEGKLLSLSFGSQGMEVKTHVLTRRPQCEVCGSPQSSADRAPPILRSRPITAGDDRSESPEATLRRLDHHISPITGIVTHLVRTSTDREGIINSYGASHKISLGPDNMTWLKQSLRSRTGGKGATDEQARAGAVCEAIERYCGLFNEDIKPIRGTLKGLGEQAVHPNACLNYSARQYAERDTLNVDISQGAFNLIPRPFPEDLEIDWTPLWSLTHKEVRYLPTSLCYYGHPDVERQFYCASDANGCAAGANPEEAIFHALLELIERDSAAIWWYNKIARPAIDLDSASDPYIDRVCDHYRREGREVWAIDLTNDVGIPVVAAVSRRTDHPTADILFGLAAHPDTSVALRRAVVEMNQFLPAVSRRDATGATQYLWPDQAAVQFWKSETLASQPQLAPHPHQAPRRLHQLPKFSGADLRDCLQMCLDAVHQHGLEVIVLDQSRPDVDLSVFRVVVPGLRHFWRRLGPGRLYDVPVKLGWLSAPIAEHDLNYRAMFF